MAVQSRSDFNSRSAFLNGTFKSEASLLSQISGRTNPLLSFTVLGKVTASEELAPYDPTATNGVELSPRIYNGPEIATSDMVAGDVELSEVVKGGDGIVDSGMIVFEGATTLDTVVGSTGKTVRDIFNDKGLFFKEVTDVEEYEN